ncbi:MAG: hypothetical protein ABIO83_00635 [Ilumatobacteraceae bacterium]
MAATSTGFGGGRGSNPGPASSRHVGVGAPSGCRDGDDLVTADLITDL